MRDIIIASTSTLHGETFLQYLIPTLKIRLELKNVKEVLFIPFARPSGISHEDYTAKVKAVFAPFAIRIKGLHEYADKVKAIKQAQAIFTGGGNTFVLVKTLHDYKCMTALREAIYNGAFYLGTSAGSNIAGLTMNNTNDMPIVMPPSFKTTGAVGYNINAHYEEPDSNSTHMGETREQRIAEFHEYQNIPVIGLREGSYINVKGDEEILEGNLQARIFIQGKPAYNVDPGFNFREII